MTDVAEHEYEKTDEPPTKPDATGDSTAPGTDESKTEDPKDPE